MNPMPGPGSAPPPPPQGGPPPPQQGGGGDSKQSPSELVNQIHTGLQSFGKILAQAGSIVSPEEQKLFQQTVTSFQALISALGQPEGGAPPPEAGPTPRNAMPMPANANAGAKPAPQY